MPGPAPQYAVLIAASTCAGVKAPEGNVAAVGKALASVANFDHLMRWDGAPGARGVEESLRDIADLMQQRSSDGRPRLLVYLHCHGTPAASWTEDFEFHFPVGKMRFGRLLEALKDTPADSVVLVVEACYSGQIARLVADRGIEHRLAVLHSCGAGELSDDGATSAGGAGVPHSDLPPSPFTRAFVEVLRGLGQGPGKDLLLDDVARQVQARVKGQTPDCYPKNRGQVLLHTKASYPDVPQDVQELGRLVFKILMDGVPSRPDMAETALLWLYATGDLAALGCGPSPFPGVSSVEREIRRAARRPAVPRDEIELLRILLGLPGETGGDPDAATPAYPNPLNRSNLCRFLCCYAEALRSRHGNPQKADEILRWIRPNSDSGPGVRMTDAEWGRSQPAALAAAQRKVWVTTTFDRGRAVEQPARLAEAWIAHAHLQLPQGAVPLLDAYPIPCGDQKGSSTPKLGEFVTKVLVELEERYPLLWLREDWMVWDFVLDSSQAHWRVEDVQVGTHADSKSDSRFLADKYRCQIRLRKRHESAPGQPPGHWRAQFEKLSRGPVAARYCSLQPEILKAAGLRTFRGILSNHPVLLAPDLFSAGHAHPIQTEADLFNSLLEAGVVVALWGRPGEPVAPGSCKQLQAALVDARDDAGRLLGIAGWPECVKCRRSEPGWQHLAFVCDPPEPKLQLKAQYSPEATFGAFATLGLRRAARSS